MNSPEQFDAIIIGSGQGGTPLSSTLARAGWRTALIESQHIGGTCINEGCTPTKTMVASGRVAYLARRAADYGVHTGSISIDLRKVRQRKRDMVDSFRNGSQNKLSKVENLELVFGEAQFVDAKTVHVRAADSSHRTLSARRIFISAGTRAARPKIAGLDSVAFLDNVSIMELDVLPEQLLVLGGGYIGLEFGQLFRRFGSRVTIIQSGSQLLAREDDDVAEEVTKILREDGVEILLSASARSVEQSGSSIRLQAKTRDGAKELSGSHLLIATGRVSNSDRLNLSAAGVNTDSHGFIEVNERLETNVEGIYALGDIKGGPAFTHIAYDDFRILKANLLENKPASTRDRQVPYCVFIDPQLGRIGMTEAEARAQGKNIRIAKLPMTSVARALEVDETRGFIKAVVEGDTQQILGAAVLGIEGGEVMAVLQTAMMGKLPYTALRDGTFAHPTLAESLNNLFMAMDAA